MIMSAMTKTIELDELAYARLEAERQGDESWSEVIKRCVRPKPSVGAILKTLRESAPDLEILEALDKTISQRRR